MSTTSKSVETYIVRVGKGNYRFDPEVVEAKEGDRIHFEFFPANHSVVWSTWDHPCIPDSYFTPGAKHENAFWSGFKPVSEIKEDWEMPWLNMTLGDSDPHYMYSSAANACNKHGMVMLLNPRAGQTIDAYRKKSLEAPYVITPGEPFPADTNPSATATTSASTSPFNSDIPSNTPSQTSKSLSGGAIAGIVIGAVLALVFVGFAGFFLARRRHQRPNKLPPGLKQGHSQFDGPAQSAPIPVSTDSASNPSPAKVVYNNQWATTGNGYDVVEELDGQPKHGPQGYIHGQEYGNPQRPAEL